MIAAQSWLLGVILRNEPGASGLPPSICCIRKRFVEEIDDPAALRMVSEGTEVPGELNHVHRALCCFYVVVPD
ncbi:hypothetical protein [Paeniglutamicibacter sp. NPDC091659]|uniref:hypothetical protein n=1 Tax=Paeniglutamicibacter sp. NPDC091659 TaxID=3364389 RepID=UPI00382B5752